MRIAALLAQVSFLMSLFWSLPAFSIRDFAVVAPPICVAAYTEVPVPKPAEPEPAPVVPVDILPPLNKIRAIQLQAMIGVGRKSDPNFAPLRRRLVEMLANTIFESGSRKMTLEKGELHLGHNLGDGRSLEFEYAGDKRSGETILRLNRILLYKPNGQSIVIAKAPITDDGRSFAQGTVAYLERSLNGPRSLEIRELDSATLKGWAGDNKELATKLEENKALGVLGALSSANDLLTEADRAALAKVAEDRQTVLVPMTIEGPLRVELETWIHRLQHLTRTELIEASANNSLAWLITKSRTRETWSFIKDRGIKKTTGLLIFLGLFYGVERATKFDISSLNIPGTSHVESLLHSPRVEAEALIVRRVFGGLSIPAEELGDLERKAAKRINRLSTLRKDTTDILREFKGKMAEQETEEIARGGEARYINGDLPNLQVPGLPQSQFGYMIGDFPKQEKVIFVPIVKGSDGAPTMMTVIPISKHAYPEIYDRIQFVLNNKKD